jgi:LPS sulfotransferase NodH
MSQEMTLDTDAAYAAWSEVFGNTPQAVSVIVEDALDALSQTFDDLPDDFLEDITKALYAAAQDKLGADWIAEYRADVRDCPTFDEWCGEAGDFVEWEPLP